MDDAPAKSNMKFCRECGAKIPRDSVFCQECGAALAQTVVQPKPTEPQPKPAHSWYANRWFFVGVILIAVIVTGLFIVIQIRSPGNFQGSYSSAGVLQSTTAAPSITQSGFAPDFTLPIVDSNGLTGLSFTLSSETGRVVLLEFMEPWSPHCQNMASILNTLYSKYGSGNVGFVSVSGPWNNASASDEAAFISQYGTNWTYVYDSSGMIFSEYGVTSVPMFYIIGTSGSIVSSLTGEQSLETLSGAISTAGGSS